jgi:hypothetical protein
MLVTDITPSNASIFPEYIIPNIKHLVQDPEVSVRCTYAQCHFVSLGTLIPTCKLRTVLIVNQVFFLFVLISLFIVITIIISMGSRHRTLPDFKLIVRTQEIQRAAPWYVSIPITSDD